MENEIWKDIPNYEGYYKISNLGNVYSVRSKKILINNNLGDYLSVTLSIRGHKKINTIHRLVAINFIDNYCNKPEVNHINGIKTDNRVENLEWVTKSENGIHAFKNGLSKPNKTNLGNFGEKSFRKRSLNVYDLSMNLLSTHSTIRDASIKYNMSESSISNYLNNKTKNKSGLIWKEKK